MKLTVCEDDPDYADGCPEKAAIKDYCQDQEDFMRKNCPKSCGFCSKGDWPNYFNVVSHEMSEKEFCVSANRELHEDIWDID